MGVAVVTDSAANLPPSRVVELGIEIVPMILRLGKRVFRDGVDLPPEGFYEMLAAEQGAVSTSGPSAGDFREVFARCLESAPGVVCVTVAASVSVTNDSALLAAREFGDRVVVVDSMSASLAEGFCALEAARSAQAGASLEEVADRAQQVAARAALVATIDTFEYLRRSGRVNALKSFAATTFNVKPVFALRGGRVEQLARPLSRGRAIDRLAEEVGRAKGSAGLHLGVVHAAAPAEAEALEARLLGELQPVESYVAEFTPLMGAHTGPGLLGVAFWA